MKRRGFLKSLGAAAALNVVPAGVWRSVGQPTPKDKVTLGLVGAGGKGRDLMFDFRNCPEVQFVAVADPDRKQAELGKATAEKHYGKGCTLYKDFRELCSRQDIDAVVVATPDHWHAIAALEAIRNGKDVYGEKPVTHLFREGKVLYQEVARRKRIFQVGSQQRSNSLFRMAAEVVLNGLIGKVREVQVGLPKGHESDKEAGQGQPIPEHLDYDFWCGPSRRLPFHPDRLHFHWRWCLDYGGGNLMDWIGHHNDIAHWGLGLDKSGPVRVEAQNFRYPDNGIYDSPIDYAVRSEYEGGYTVTISNRFGMGTRWIGDDGWVSVGRRRLNASNPEWIREETDRGPIKAYSSSDHRRNFVDGVLTRKECICPAETGHRSITPGHLGYVSDKLKRPIRWDPGKEMVVEDPEADKLLNQLNYRGEWVL